MPEKLTAVDIHRRLSKRDSAIELHREALAAGLPLSRYLEVLNPSEENSSLDAFGRQLREAGIVTRSDPKAGYWASKAIRFFETDAGRALYPEFFARQWREVAFATPQQRAILLSSDSVIGGWDRPYADAAGPRWNDQFAPAIPLSELVAMTTPITGEDYRSLYMTYDEDELRMFRVGESAEIPMAELESSERAIRLRKYGRGLRTTYEQLRRMRVDRLAWWIRWVALQSEVDKVAAALAVLINGDGNANTAATEVDLTDLHSGATPGTLSLEGWLAFRLLFEQPYMLTTALMQSAEALQLIMLNSGSANIPLAGLNLAGIGNTLTPINTTADGIRYGWTSDAPADKIVGFDRRFALEHVMEIGSEISETERFITNQTQVITMTENSAFAVLDPSAARVLDLETPG
jgi:hypothetical protein